ncbi:MAG: hypothetical protein L0228_10930 [Planctomycetes bacterium]|nr:hypothetical protein [Planctomycetota bacterium]
MPPWSRVLCSLVITLAFPAAAIAVEPAEDFLRGLEERGLNELALDYLEHLKTSQAVDDAFRQKIPYHRGVVLIEQSRQSADSATRSRLLEEARVELERFAASNPESAQGADASLQLASVQLAGGQQLIAQMSQLSAEPAFDEQRKKLGRDARDMFANARSMFERAEAIYSAELEKLPPTTSDAKGDAGNQRQEYRARVAQLRFLAAQTQFEMAQSYPPEADEFRQLNEAAAAELAAVYEKFARAFIVGLYARLYEGRCYQAVGSHQLALGCFEGILKQPNVVPPFRKLIASAVHRKAEVLIAQEKYDQAIEACNICLRDAKADEEKQAEWLAVRFRLAEALQKQGEALAADTLAQRKLLAEARDAYRVVANSPGEFQTAARTAVSALSKSNGAGKDQPQTFQAAYDRGKDALASYNAAKLALPSAEKNNPDAIPELESQMRQGKQEARENFRAATTLVDDDTDPKLLNEVRYFLCWLYWESADFYRAAVLGEFLARRYPDHPAAASAAKLAMAAYERLYSQAAGDGKKNSASNTDFEAAQMAKMAEFITRRWPNTEDADAAQSVLVSFAIRSNRIEEAEKLLETASPESRPRLELQLGNAMWGRYLELSQPNGQSAPDAAALAQLKESAVKYLRNGFEAARGEREPSESTAAAGLYFAQALLSDEKYGAAIELLEDVKIGPLTLVSKEHPAASRPQYAVEAYKAALRAYVLSTPPQEKKALAIMKSLDDAVTASGGSGEQLTQIYIGLGVALEKQAAQLREAGRNADAARINAAFAQFLDRIAAREADANWPTRAWLAQTYYNMGTPQRAGPSPAPTKPLSESSRAYLTKARDAYQKLIADAAKNPKLPPSETSVLAARLQLGECLRALGQYKQALDTFSAVLKERESSLAVQKAAAQTYQARGQAEDARWLENAIHGGHKLKSTGQNRIWGWLKISQVAARAARSDEKYRDTFFEARVNVARCRYLAAMKSKGDQRKRDLAKAKQSIQSLAQVYPDLGGEHWRGEFDTLLKQIQSASGQKALGLSEFKSEESTGTGGRPG